MKMQLKQVSLTELREQLPVNREGNRTLVVAKQDDKLSDRELFLKYAAK